MPVEYPGDATYAASPASRARTVSTNPSTLYVAPRTGRPGERVVLCVALRSGSTRISGLTVSYSIDGTSVRSTTTPGGLGLLGFPITDSPGIGPHTVAACFAGHADLSASVASAAMIIDRALNKPAGRIPSIRPGTTGSPYAWLSVPGGSWTGGTARFCVGGTFVGSAVTGSGAKATLPCAAALPVASNAPLATFDAADRLAASSAQTTLEDGY